MRMVLPGLAYTLPPMQDKLNLLETDSDTIQEALDKAPNTELSKALLSVLQGMSPGWGFCREIAQYVTRHATVYKDDLTEDQKVRLSFLSAHPAEKAVRGGSGRLPCSPKKNGKPREFSFFNITQARHRFNRQAL